MAELSDVPGAFGYGDSMLVGERVRLRGVRDDDLPALARWEMDPGRLITLSNWVAPPSEAAAKERVAKRSTNDEDELGFAIETLGDPPVLTGLADDPRCEVAAMAEQEPPEPVRCRGAVRARVVSV